MSEAIIKIESLYKQFYLKGQKISALEDINLEINRGEVFGIIGMSGAGKSTLVRCLNFLEVPSEGQIIFNDKSLGQLSQMGLRQVRREMGMIFQQFNLLMQRTALENVCFPLTISGMKKQDAQKRALELLEIVGLSDRANSYPSQLSGGQKQRVAIARALATEPKVLLCDEATSALDPETTKSVLRLLKELNEKMGITIIIITHEMSVIEEICQRVAIIADHKIAEVGTVQEIFTHPKTEATKRLVYQDTAQTPSFNPNRGKQLRIVFNGGSSFEPVLSQMVLDLKIQVNIMFADTKNIDGRAFGQLVIQLPDEVSSEKVLSYLKTKNVQVEEVTQRV
jgi:hypothetical protein